MLNGTVTVPDLALVRRLVTADHGLAVVATTRRDGSVHTSVVNAGVYDAAAGPAVAFVARSNAKKIDHLRRSGRAAVVFRHGWEWVSVEGPVHVVGPDEAGDGLPAVLRAVFRAAGGSHDNWDEYDRVMAAEGRIAVLVDPVRITGNA
jgi:PPOX class probable F420-dependent enzyme